MKELIERKCYTCKTVKPISEFARTKKEKSGFQFQCKCCKKDENMKRRYGITKLEYTIIFDKQEGFCAICNKHQIELLRALDIDHSHSTGKVRGLLCNSCNQAIGSFKDNIEIIKNAIKYLEQN